MLIPWRVSIGHNRTLGISSFASKWEVPMRPCSNGGRRCVPDAPWDLEYVPPFTIKFKPNVGK